MKGFFPENLGPKHGCALYMGAHYRQFTKEDIQIINNLMRKFYHHYISEKCPLRSKEMLSHKHLNH